MPKVSGTTVLVAQQLVRSTYASLRRPSALVAAVRSITMHDPAIQNSTTRSRHQATQDRAASLLDAVAKGSFSRAAYLLREKDSDPNAVDQQGDLSKLVYLSKVRDAST